MLSLLCTCEDNFEWFPNKFIIMNGGGGAGMKNQVLVGYRVFKKNQVWVESSSGPRKTLPEDTCITSEVIHRHKS